MAELASLELENKSWPRGTHSLRYHYLALSEPGPGLPQFLAVGYVDDQPFIRYDSRVGRAQSQAPWMVLVDAQYWERETQKQRGWEKVQQVEMWTVMGYHNLSSGKHSAQRMFGCEIQEDGRSNSFWQFGFNGQDHLSLDLDTLSWVSAHPVALRTKRWWETERCYAQYDKAYLQGLCLTSLRRYLELGGQSLTRTESPSHPRLIADLVIFSILVTISPVAAVVIWIKKKPSARDKESYQQAPGEEDLHKSQSTSRVVTTQHLC
ncbi:major histocompatibility complex class I-related gene protein-like isoform X4 [Elephas maximus indicus]|uniref:major histocompatibility complex class I-related gene protein-like isoform X4 n=1 Tax=Elephas maximus indicus TaxID=99487 RepID=UPI0021160CEA|nr:major histocompatibility complex class I-related gene protein-like isoform X4 [Elephas maximus indicus]